FTQQIRFDDYTDEELAEIFVQIAARYDYAVDDEVRVAVETYFSGVTRSESFGNGRAARTLFEAAVGNQASRVADLMDPSTADLAELRVADVFPTAAGGEHRSRSGLDAAISELDQMVGLDSVKSEIRQLLAVVQANDARRRLGLSAPSVARHLVFAGPPGTGKTTVAKHLAQALRSLGVIERGHLVAVTKADLVAQWLGQTPVKTRAVVNRALDGVLFIDEAYSLTSDDEDLYGREAVEMLLKMMEDHRERLVVIVAGYPDEMDRFLESNPGLRSRFTKRLDFPSYSTEQLVEIFVRLAQSEGYQLGEGTMDRLRSRLGSVGDLAAF
ncbi:MAG: AAA family ATPase, partial [Microthrixaceae bacterium]